MELLFTVIFQLEIELQKHFLSFQRVLIDSFHSGKEEEIVLRVE
jgi:hypothetical protein